MQGKEKDAFKVSPLMLQLLIKRHGWMDKILCNFLFLWRQYCVSKSINQYVVILQRYCHVLRIKSHTSHVLLYNTNQTLQNRFDLLSCSLLEHLWTSTKESALFNVYFYKLLTLKSVKTVGDMGLSDYQLFNWIRLLFKLWRLNLTFNLSCRPIHVEGWYYYIIAVWYWLKESW